MDLPKEPNRKTLWYRFPQNHLMCFVIDENGLKDLCEYLDGNFIQINKDSKSLSTIVEWTPFLVGDHPSWNYQNDETI